MSRIQEIFNRMQMNNGVWKATLSGDSILCCCQAHNDKNPSLSISQGHSRIVWCCQAGCDEAMVRDSVERVLGMTLNKLKRELAVMKKTGNDGTEAAALPVKVTEIAKVVAVYDYYNYEKELIGKKKKFDDTAKRKYQMRYLQGFSKEDIEVYGAEFFNKWFNGDKTRVGITEGEKDADTVRKLGIYGVSGYGGAKGKLSPMLSRFIKKAAKKKDCEFFIFQDNDEAGRKFSNVLMRNVRQLGVKVRAVKFEDMPEKNDVTDYYNKFGAEAAKMRIETSEEDGGEKIYLEDDKTLAKEKEFNEVFEDYFGTVKKDIFSGTILHYDTSKDHYWQPITKLKKNVRGYILSRGDDIYHPYKYKDQQTEFRLSYWTDQFKPELCVEIPEYEFDGVQDFCKRSLLYNFINDVIEIDESDPINPGKEAFLQLFCEWFKQMWKKFEYKDVQNKVFILQGNQGLGKDAFFKAIFKGLGQFFTELNMNNKNPVDIKMSMHKGLALNIAEFDRTSKKHVAELKEIFTASTTNLRKAYAEDSQVRDVRCSFMASCNDDDILRDWTGNRRYLIFHVKGINLKRCLETTEEESLRMLGEAKYLYKIDYTPTKEAVKKMKEYIDLKTPENPRVSFRNSLLEVVQEWWNDSCDYAGLMTLPNSYRPYAKLAMAEARVEMRRKGEAIKGESGVIFLPNDIIESLVKKAKERNSIRSQQIINSAKSEFLYKKTVRLNGKVVKGCVFPLDSGDDILAENLEKEEGSIDELNGLSFEDYFNL